VSTRDTSGLQPRVADSVAPRLLGVLPESVGGVISDVARPVAVRPNSLVLLAVPTPGLLI
jgi:hypothetical protein